MSIASVVYCIDTKDKNVDGCTYILCAYAYEMRFSTYEFFSINQNRDYIWINCRLFTLYDNYLLQVDTRFYRIWKEQILENIKIINEEWIVIVNVILIETFAKT